MSSGDETKDACPLSRLCAGGASQTVHKMFFDSGLRRTDASGDAAGLPTQRKNGVAHHRNGLPSPSLAGTEAAAAVRTPTEEEIEGLRRASLALENAQPEEVVRWAVENYFPKLTMATAFGPEGCLILSMLAKIEPRVYVFNLDTGYQFQETLDMRDRIAERYGLEVHFERPDLSVEEFEAAHGGPIYASDSNRCCGQRKLAVLRRVSKRFDAWMSGIRRDQSPHRAAAPIVGWDKKFGLVKISPLANYTKKQVWERIVRENVPYNPLHDQGYASIGCWPCTRPVVDGEDERAGRWSGSSKTECGLHTAEG